MTQELFEQAQNELLTLRDLMRFAVSRFHEAGLFFGQAAVAIGLADAIGTFDDALTQLLESVSSFPNVAASHSGAFRNLQTESFMNDRTDTAALDRPLVDPAGSSAQPPAAATLSAGGPPT